MRRTSNLESEVILSFDEKRERRHQIMTREERESSTGEKEKRAPPVGERASGVSL